MWKLKYALGLSHHKARKVSFWLYWRLCGSCRVSDQRLGKRLRAEGICLSPERLSESWIQKINAFVAEQSGKRNQWLCVSGDHLEKGLDEKKHKVAHLSNIQEALSLREWLDLVDVQFGETLRSYYGSEYRCVSVDYYVTRSLGDKEEGSFMWHIDDHPAGLLKGFIYLADVDQSTGPFRCLPKTARMRRKTSAYLSHDEGTDHRYLADVDKKLGISPRDIVGEAGTSFVVNANTLHRATTVQKGERRVLCFVFLPSMRSPLEEAELRPWIKIENQPDRLSEPVWSFKPEGS